MSVDDMMEISKLEAALDEICALRSDDWDGDLCEHSEAPDHSMPHIMIQSNTNCNQGYPSVTPAARLWPLRVKVWCRFPADDAKCDSF